MIVDRLSNGHFYSRVTAWRRAFEYLATLDATTQENDYFPLAGDDMFARVMRYDTKSPAEGAIEAHDQYLDIQVSLQHSEGIEWFPREHLEVKIPYDSAKDVVFFRPTEVVPARVDNLPGFFTALWPHDAHRPQLSTGAPGWVKKVVIKVRLELLADF